MTSMLQEIAQERVRHREELRGQVRGQLRAVLGQLLPGCRVILFGSLVKPGRFSETSDIDVALDAEPPGLSVYQLTSLLAERMGRGVDVLLLSETRLRDRILRDGEIWTLPA